MPTTPADNPWSRILQEDAEHVLHQAIQHGLVYIDWPPGDPYYLVYVGSALELIPSTRYHFPTDRLRPGELFPEDHLWVYAFDRAVQALGGEVILDPLNPFDLYVRFPRTWNPGIRVPRAQRAAVH
jgi:hypothetical protein